MRSILDFVNEHCRCYNYYNPAEYAGAAVQYLITDNDVVFLPIGRPISSVHVYFLDKYVQSVISGVQIGEIVIGGNIILKKLVIFFSTST